MKISFLGPLLFFRFLFMSAFLIVNSSWAESPKDTSLEKPGKVSQHESDTNYFYQPLTYGTQGKYNPGDFFINGGFGVWQFNPNRKILNIPITAEWQNTWESMRHPLWAIEQFGYKEWFFSEVCPSSFEIKKGQFFPNYALHIIGAGMQSRKMEEWYKYHDVPYPRIIQLSPCLVSTGLKK